MINYDLYITYCLDNEEKKLYILTSNLNLNEKELEELRKIYLKYDITESFIYFTADEYTNAKKLISDLTDEILDLIHKTKLTIYQK